MPLPVGEAKPGDQPAAAGQRLLHELGRDIGEAELRGAKDGERAVRSKRAPSQTEAAFASGAVDEGTGHVERGTITPTHGHLEAPAGRFRVSRHKVDGV